MIPSVIIIRLGSSAAPQCINQWDFSVLLLPHTLYTHSTLEPNAPTLRLTFTIAAKVSKCCILMEDFSSVTNFNVDLTQYTIRDLNIYYMPSAYNLFVIYYSLVTS